MPPIVGADFPAESSSPLLFVAKAATSKNVKKKSRSNQHAGLNTSSVAQQQPQRTEVALQDDTPELILDNDIWQSTAEPKLCSELWFIKGEFYDLTTFLPQHPGGQTILKLSRGLEDTTPLMESYHAFANQDYIKSVLGKYKVPYVPKDVETQKKTRTEYTFEENGFYSTLRRRVRAHFGAKTSNVSVTRNIKANKWWLAKVIVQAVLFVSAYLLAFVVEIEDSRILSICSALFAGVMMIAVGMNSMHDGSHYAIATRNSWENQFVMRAWNAIAFWDPARWLYHHTVRHHAYTGDDLLDPDTTHAIPVIRKHEDTDRNEYVYFPRILAAQRWFWTIWASLIYTILPGMYFSQAYSYQVRWPILGELWNMKLSSTRNAIHKYAWEWALSLLMIGAQIHKADALVSLAYFFGANVAYAICIIPDHDTFESVVENSTSGGRKDWGEIQVRHSSDFSGQGVFGRAFSQMFGSINIQIEHHLFPSLNHVYLSEIAPIVQETCAEFSIPYVRQSSIPTALWSFIWTVHECMGPSSNAQVKVT